MIRYALRAHFPTMRADRENTLRVDELRDEMRLDEDRLAMIIADARLVAKDIEKVIGEAPAERKTTERIRKRQR